MSEVIKMWEKNNKNLYKFFKMYVKKVRYKKYLKKNKGHFEWPVSNKFNVFDYCKFNDI